MDATRAVKGRLLVPAALLAGLLFSGAAEAGENRSGARPSSVARALTAEQKATLAQLSEELSNAEVKNRQFISGAEQEQIIQTVSGISDPVLVGRNVVFDPAWLTYASKKQVQTARDNSDKAYETLAYVFGRGPVNGREKIYVFLFDNHPQAAWTGAFAHKDLNLLVFSKKGQAERKGTAIHSLVGRLGGGTAVHEMTHLFEGWRESHGMTYYVERWVIETIGNREEKKASQEGRRKTYRQAVEQARKGDVVDCESAAAVNVGYAHPRALQCLFYNGLQEKVGWEPFRKAIQSYENDSYVPEYAYAGRNGKRREFWDRVAYFSGKPEILDSLPGGTRLLNEALQVTPTARGN